MRLVDVKHRRAGWDGSMWAAARAVPTRERASTVCRTISYPRSSVRLLLLVRRTAHDALVPLARLQSAALVAEPIDERELLDAHVRGILLVELLDGHRAVDEHELDLRGLHGERGRVGD